LQAELRSPLPNGTALLGGAYLIESCLGTGGFAITYRARDRGLDRPVAIKEFFPHGCLRVGQTLIPGSEWTDEVFARYRARALEEGRRLAMLHHPGIVMVHAVFEENNTVYLVMELVEGEALDQHLVRRGGSLPAAEAVDLIAQAAAALSVVHQAGLLHRDLKPQNLIRRPDGRVLLIDFGSARELLPEAVHTRTVVLTPGYAPLEQYSPDGRLGPSSDIYSLAATAYYLLVGRPPRDAPSRVNHAPDVLPPSELRSDVPLAVSDAIMRGLSMSPGERQGSAEEFQRQLARPAGADVFLVAPHRRAAFLWRFIWMSALGGTLGVMAGQALGNLAHRAMGATPDSVPGAWAISGALAGLGLGAGQWLALRRHLRYVWLWPIVTISGTSLGNVLGWMVGDALGWTVAGSRDNVWAVTGLVLGAAVGGGQWLVLRGQVKRARMWVGMTVAGKGAGNLLAVGIGATSGAPSVQMMGWAVGGVAVVLAQAFCLAFFRRKGREGGGGAFLPVPGAPEDDYGTRPQDGQLLL